MSQERVICSSAVGRTTTRPQRDCNAGRHDPYWLSPHSLQRGSMNITRRRCRPRLQLDLRVGISQEHAIRYLCRPRIAPIPPPTPHSQQSHVAEHACLPVPGRLCRVVSMAFPGGHTWTLGCRCQLRLLELGPPGPHTLESFIHVSMFAVAKTASQLGAVNSNPAAIAPHSKQTKRRQNDGRALLFFVNPSCGPFDNRSENKTRPRRCAKGHGMRLAPLSWAVGTSQPSITQRLVRSGLVSPGAQMRYNAVRTSSAPSKPSEAKIPVSHCIRAILYVTNLRHPHHIYRPMASDSGASSPRGTNPYPLTTSYEVPHRSRAGAVPVTHNPEVHSRRASHIEPSFRPEAAV